MKIDTNVELAKGLAVRVMVDSIWRSTQIEGLDMQHTSVWNLVVNDVSDGLNFKEILFCYNMQKAWNFLLENVGEKNNIALLREFNRICGHSLFQEAGAIRTRGIHITGCKWIPPIPQHGTIIDDLRSINDIYDATERAIELLCYVARNQLFIDGNKRVAQLVFNKVLIENGIGFLHFTNDEQVRKLMNLLVDYYESGDNKDLSEYLQLECIYRV